jgi:hypothetical protein
MRSFDNEVRNLEVAYVYMYIYIYIERERERERERETGSTEVVGF